jgi:hypothetical protein
VLNAGLKWEVESEYDVSDHGEMDFCGTNFAFVTTVGGLKFDQWLLVLA